MEMNSINADIVRIPNSKTLVKIDSGSGGDLYFCICNTDGGSRLARGINDQIRAQKREFRRQSNGSSSSALISNGKNNCVRPTCAIAISLVNGFAQRARSTVRIGSHSNRIGISKAKA